jgi:hypothetical protein
VGCEVWCLKRRHENANANDTKTTDTDDPSLVLGYMYLERHVILHDCRTTVVRAIRICPDYYPENDNIYGDANVDVDTDSNDSFHHNGQYRAAANVVEKLIQELVVFAIQCSIQYGTTHVGVYTEKCPIQEAALDSLCSYSSSTHTNTNTKSYIMDRTTHPDGRPLYMTANHLNHPSNNVNITRATNTNTIDNDEKDDTTNHSDIRWDILKGAFQRQLQLQSRHLDQSQQTLQQPPLQTLQQPPVSLVDQQQQQQNNSNSSSSRMHRMQGNNDSVTASQQQLPITTTQHDMKEPPSKRLRAHNDDTL